MSSSRTALITGASSGIGRELAMRFAREGFDLILVARDESRLADAAEEARGLGASVTLLPRDLSEPGAARGVFDAVTAQGTRIDVLVNNAGFNVYGPYCETDGRQEIAMLQVNVMALARLTKLFLPAMVVRGTGCILNLGSTGSFSPGPLDALYCASKAFVLSFSEALAEELAGTGVTVTALCPGPTGTRFAERAGMGDVRLFQLGVMPASEVADAGFRGLMHGRRVVVPGLVNKLMAFSVRVTPRRVVTWSSKLLLGRGEAAWTLAREAGR